MTIQNLLEIVQGTPKILLGLCSLGTLVIIFFTQQFLSWRKLRHVPGPFWNSFQSIRWMVKTSLSGSQYVDLMVLQEKYGPLVRVGRNKVITDDPDVLRRIQAVRSPYTKSPWYYPKFRTVPQKDSIFTQADEAKHAEIRQKVAPGYGGKENESVEGTVDMVVAQLVALIERKYLSDPKSGKFRLFNLASAGQSFAFDVISGLGWGKTFGFTEKDEDIPNPPRTFADFVPFTVTVVHLPVIPWLLQIWPFHLMQPKPGDKVGLGKLMGLAMESVNERLVPGTKQKRDMLGSFIAHGLTPGEIICETFNLIIAGSDSTASAFRTTMAFLLVTPTAYTTLQAEIDGAIAAGKISSPVKDSEAKALPYLQAVLKEGLRMLPPNTAFMYKRVPKGGDVVHGYHLPEDTEVGCCFYGMTHKKDFWGADADVFRPERWLEGDEARRQKMQGVVDLTFGYGKYHCLGKNIAFIELNKVFVELLRRFNFAAANPATPFKIVGAGFYVISDQWLRVTRRENALIRG